MPLHVIWQQIGVTKCNNIYNFVMVTSQLKNLEISGPVSVVFQLHFTLKAKELL